MKSKILITLLLLMILAGGAVFLLNPIDYLTSPVDPANSEEVLITIPSGSSTTRIADILKENDLIKSVNGFKFLSKDMNADGKMQAGDYLLNQAMSSEAIIEKLISGDTYVETVKFTVPEGYEVLEIADMLAGEGIVDYDEFVRVLEFGEFDYRFLEGIDRSKRLEGFLFPDTYEIVLDADEYDIINMMLKRFDEVFKDEYYAQAESLGMSVNEIITLASIIEREIVVDEERPVASGVFYNRLDIDMGLQSCATVQYVLPERKENLSIKDTKYDSPYNTYIHPGLPPAPIACPGEKSIKAALYPEDTDYKYFVASSSGDGSHIFSVTYEEHLKAKNSQ